MSTECLDIIGLALFLRHSPQASSGARVLANVISPSR